MQKLHSRRLRLTRRFAVVGLLVGMLACTAGPTSSGAATRPHTGPTGSIVIGESASMTTLNPILNAGLDQVFTIFNGLTEISNTGTVVPGLATSWSANANATKWVFTLRPGVTFTDGEKVTPADVIWTFTTMMQPGSNMAIYLTDVKSMHVQGTNQVVFYLKTPYAPWPRELTLLAVLPEKYYKTVGATKFDTDPIGTGPYKVVSFNPGSSLTLTANTGFWGTAPTVKKVIYQYVSADSARADGIQSGSFNLALIAPTLLGTVAHLSGYKTESIPSDQAYYVGFNMSVAPENSLDFREGVDAAIDRAGITKSVFGGLAKPVGQVVAPVTFGFDPAIKATAYNPTKAAQLIKESGYSGQPITIDYPTDGYPLMTQAVQVIGAELQAAGINVSLQGTEFDTFILNWEDKKFGQLFVFAFHPSTLDAGLPIDYMYGPNGFGYFTNAEVDSLITKQYAEPVASQRLATIAKIWDITKSQELYAPLYVDDYSYSVSKRIVWKPRPDGLILPEYITWAK